ncbi:MAG: radical SAM protein [Pseudomonadota bacterium]
MADGSLAPPNLGKFVDPAITADGSARATVDLDRLETLWFNTGTLCNIECANCYIFSSPKNDALVYLKAEEVERYLDEIGAENMQTREIGFTGGEPFMNPDILKMVEASLTRGFEVLVLTNAMRPMMRPKFRDGLAALNERFADLLTLRISVDHHTPEHHDAERGKGAFDRMLEGMRFLSETGIRMSVAGRTIWGEAEKEARDGFRALFEREGFAIDADHPGELVLFPEMDMRVEVPEITTACWGILDKSPSEVMCANARMVVKRKGAEKPAVLACTLLAYEDQFEMGETLAEASRPVALNHPHCAKFCVLGGASCSA